MTPQNQIKALAELDGAHQGHWTEYATTSASAAEVISGRMWSDSGWTYANGQVHSNHPHYLTSYDAILPLIQKQDGNMRLCMFNQYFQDVGVYKETPAQLCEALLRATGKWKE